VIEGYLFENSVVFDNRNAEKETVDLTPAWEKPKPASKIQTFDLHPEISLPDSFFDVAIGNVPFGQFKLSDKHHFLVHDYFFAKTLDKVRPGGVIAFITSKGAMDKQNPSIRKYIAQRAELLGAIRLPDNTFKANAETKVKERKEG